MWCIILAWLFPLLGSASYVEPRYPLDAVAGGTVVAEVTSIDGAVREVDILYSDAPFANPVKNALARWRLESEGIRKTLVVVHFRHPQIYLMGPAKQEIPLREHPKSLPYPKYIVQPPYPINVIGETSVVFSADISEKGAVSDVKIVRSPGNLTAGLDAVKKWEFLPARNVSGIESTSHAYIVLVFRPPITTPPPK